MKYNPDDFLALSSAVLDDGGTILSGACEPKVVKLRFDNGVDDPKWKRYYTAGCGMSARFEIPYNPVEQIDLGDVFVDNRLVASMTYPTHKATVCAVDDSMGYWPRYKDVVSSRSYLR